MGSKINDPWLVRNTIESTIRICKYFQSMFAVEFPKVVKTPLQQNWLLLNKLDQFVSSLNPTKRNKLKF